MIGLVYYSKFAQSTRNRESMERVRYQWPASALTDKEMEILYQWRGKTGTPICELLGLEKNPRASTAMTGW